MKNILVIGFSTRNIVCSGKRAGYNMYALDAFCDHDLKECADDAMQFDIGEEFDIKRMDPEEILHSIEAFDVDFDAIIPGSGFETMDLSDCKYPVLSNDMDTMRKVSDKSIFANILKSMGLPHPEVFSHGELEKVTYPVMVKPVSGGGGIFNRVAHSREELQSYISHPESRDIPLSGNDVLIQEYISGIPASVSVISTKDSACSVAVNEQLIGIPWLTDMPFAFCGNITPFENKYAERMKQLAEEMILELGLIGSNGVDFLVTDKGPVIIEVNARFQGSLDSVELSTGINVFEAHVQAFEGRLLRPDPTEEKYAGRAIIYAHEEVTITEDIQRTILSRMCADIPNSGHISHENEPVTSVFATGKTRDEVLNKLKDSVMFIRESLDVMKPEHISKDLS